MNTRANMARVSWMAVALLPLLTGLAVAVNSASPQFNQPNQQDEQIATTPEQTQELQPGEFQPKLEKAKDLIGARVLNENDERLGTVEDIVLTPGRDAISYVVLSHGGLWGMGDKFFAVPWSQFSFKPAAPDQTDKEKVLVLSGVNRADLERAPGFDKKNWPTTASASWLGIERDVVRRPEVKRGFDDEPNLEETPYEGTAPRAREPVVTEPPADREESARVGAPERAVGAEAARVSIEDRRLSKVFGTTVENLQGEDLGELNNAMIDVHQGKLAYGIVEMSRGFLGLDKTYAAVPWSAFDFAGKPDVVRLDVDQQTLTAMAFEENNFPNLEDPQYSRQLYERFRATPYWETLGFVPGEDEQRDSSTLKDECAEHSGMSHPNQDF